MSRRSTCVGLFDRIRCGGGGGGGGSGGWYHSLQVWSASAKQCHSVSIPVHEGKTECTCTGSACVGQVWAVDAE
jgi:hypothetical protein